MNKKILRVFGGVILIIIVVILLSAVIYMVINHNKKQNAVTKCAPLNGATVDLINEKKIHNAYEQLSIANTCTVPAPASFKNLSGQDKIAQFDASYSLALEAYTKGDKKKATDIANVSLSAFQAMSQLERDNARGFVAKLVSINDIKKGVY